MAAALAMQGLLTHSEQQTGHGYAEEYEHAARVAARHADALLVELDKSNPPEAPK